MTRPRRWRPRKPLLRRPAEPAATQPTDTHATQVLAATLGELRESLAKDMPAGALREYWLWGLDPHTPQHHDFVQVIGARQLCRLTESLLADLVDDDKWPALTRLAATMNVYQLYEIVSDNLGIGAHGAPVLRLFNQAMITVLEGAAVPAAHLLAPAERPARQLSGFTQSLAGPAHRRMASAFTEGRSRPAIKDIEYGIWPALVANIIAAAAVADRLANLSVGPLLRDGLINRYHAVNRTLTGAHLPLFELATIGAHAILVAPTLGFYVAALGELLSRDPGFPGCVMDGTLADVLADAALLVRLLNDIGPGLLTCSPFTRSELLRRLADGYTREPTRYPDLPALLTSAPEATVLTRLRKDVEHGEFNIALYGARLAQSVPAALDSLARALDYFATVYAVHTERLRQGLSLLHTRLRDPRPLSLIPRFLTFHRTLYSHPHTAPSGEYAILDV